jgi:hypothetical protein
VYEWEADQKDQYMDASDREEVRYSTSGESEESDKSEKLEES